MLKALLLAEVGLESSMDPAAIDRALSSQLCPRCITLFLAPKNEEHLKVRLSSSAIADYNLTYKQFYAFWLIDALWSFLSTVHDIVCLNIGIEVFFFFHSSYRRTMLEKKSED